VEFLSGVDGCGCPIEQIELKRPILYTLTQYVNDAVLSDLCGEARKEFEAVDVLGVIRQCQLLEGVGLSGLLVWYELRPVSVAVGWGVLGLIRSEIEWSWQEGLDLR
jgi:hypothetical protein